MDNTIILINKGKRMFKSKQRDPDRDFNMMRLLISNLCWDCADAAHYLQVSPRQVSTWMKEQAPIAPYKHLKRMSALYKRVCSATREGIGRDLKAFKSQLGLSRGDLARYMEVPMRDMGRYEDGQRLPLGKRLTSLIVCFEHLEKGDLVTILAPVVDDLGMYQSRLGISWDLLAHSLGFNVKDVIDEKTDRYELSVSNLRDIQRLTQSLKGVVRTMESLKESESLYVTNM